MSADMIPPVEPQAPTTVLAPTSTARKREKRDKSKQTVVAPDKLLPNLDEYASSTVGYWYWVGVIPECPVQAIDCAGINFPLFNADLIPDGQGMNKRHLPKVGAITFITEETIRKMREKLPRIVLRFEEDRAAPPKQGLSLTNKDSVKRRKGHPITIPTPQELADARAQGRGTLPYVRGKYDEPAACYMFAIPCEDQENPQRMADSYPDTLDITGLVWPAPVEL